MKLASCASRSFWYVSGTIVTITFVKVSCAYNQTRSIHIMYIFNIEETYFHINLVFFFLFIYSRAYHCYYQRAIVLVDLQYTNIHTLSQYLVNLKVVSRPVTFLEPFIENGAKTRAPFMILQRRREAEMGSAV